jgi:hypothetical protein
VSQPRAYVYRRWNPFIRSITFTNGEAGRYIYLEHWRWTQKVRRIAVWSGLDWVNVPENILEAEPRDIPLLRDYSKILGIDFDRFLNDEIQMFNNETGEV